MLCKKDHLFSHWIISDLFKATLDGVNRKPALIETRPNLSDIFPLIVMGASALIIFPIEVIYVYNDYILSQ